MAQNLSVIGIDPDELHWIRMLVLLMRHPDPSIPELARQALIYLSDSAANRALRSRSESDFRSDAAAPDEGSGTAYRKPHDKISPR